MRKHKRIFPPPLSLLSPIPEDSEWSFSKPFLEEYEEIYQSKLCHKFPSNTIQRKNPNSIIKYCRKLFHSCRSQLSKKPELSLQYSLQILWLIENIRKISDEIIKSAGQCERVATSMLEQSRKQYIKVHFS
uniref:Uncharacterized protein n=1 Tax=Panagrolaimus sp. ES5 TaxID=591445 RepID=A0AC34G848_9BILA